MQNQLIVCTTGFTSESKEDEKKYIQYVGQLGCTYVQDMKQQTNLLIVNSTATQKYKIANLKMNSVHCVTKDWILQSKKMKKTLQAQKFSIPSIFYGVFIGIAGFKVEQLVKIESIIKQNGGKSIRLNKQVNLQKLQLSCILSNQHEAEKLMLRQQTSIFPIVGLDWLELSFRQKICKFPKDYAYNYQFLRNPSKPINLQKHKLANRLKQITSRTLLSGQEDYLKQTIIFIDESVDHDLSQILKKNICPRGGSYLKRLSAVVTHVLVGSIANDAYRKYLKYGDVVQIIRVQWLIDSIYIYQRMNEEDYRVRQFIEKSSKKINLESRRQSIDLGSLMKQNRGSISTVSKQIKKINVKFKSIIFKSLNFCIEPSQKRQKQMVGLGTKIRQNGGNIWDGVSSKSNKHFYLVMTDTYDNKSIFQKHKKYKELITPVSYRWINYCVGNNELVPHDKDNYYVFRPFCIKTPNPSFLSYKIQTLCDDDSLKRRVRQVLSVLGCPAKFSMSQITHCICINQFRTISKYKEIVNSNINVKFVKLQWILNCLSEAKVVDVTDFLIQ